MSYEGDLATHYNGIRQKLIGSPPVAQIVPSFPRHPSITKNDLQTVLLRIQAIEERLTRIEASQEKTADDRKEEKASYTQDISTPELTVNDVFQLVRNKEKAKGDLLLGVRRNSQIAHLRHIIFYLAAKKTNRSFPQIGTFMKRDHSTIIYGSESIARKRLKDPVLNEKLVWYENELEVIKEAKAQAYLAKYLTIAQDTLTSGPNHP